MDIEKILSLIGADKLEPALQGEVRELIGVLIEVRSYPKIRRVKKRNMILLKSS
jgi:hypothetical protein